MPNIVPKKIDEPVAWARVSLELYDIYIDTYIDNNVDNTLPSLLVQLFQW